MSENEELASVIIAVEAGAEERQASVEGKGKEKKVKKRRKERKTRRAER